MDAQGIYRQQTVETASPAQLISMLYHGAIARVVSAQERIASGRPDLANDELQRAQAIVFELQSALDFERGGQIASNLAALYTFCVEGLIAANVSKDGARLGPVRETLAGLASAWDEMSAAQTRAASGAVHGAPHSSSVAAAG